MVERSSKTTPLRQIPLGIALAYGFVAGLWILLAGYLVAVRGGDPQTHWHLKMVTGLAFASVIATGALLFLLWRRQRRTATLTLLAQSAEHERSLREQEAVYREMFEANPHPMWVYDTRTLGFLAVNDAAVEHYGYSREQFLSMTLADIRPAEDVPRLLRHLDSQPLEGIDTAGIWRHRKADGTLIEVEIRSHQLLFNGVLADMVLAYDLTRQRQAEARLKAAEQFSNAIIDALALNIAVIDANGIIVATNRAWRDFAAANGGAESRTGVGANYLETVRRACTGDGAGDSSDAATVLAELEGVMAGEHQAFSHEYPCHSPSQQRWFLVQITRFEVNGERWLVVAHENITRRKMAEDAVRKLNRYYAALSRMNALLIRGREPEDILAGVCRIAVEQGELELVWVGQTGEQATLEPLAWAGPATDYLDGILIGTDPDKPESQGPAGIAVRTGQATVFNRFATDSRTRPWHESASTWNLRAAAVCPIRRQAGTWGIIAFYASQEDYFNEELVALLEELTADLAFSLDSLDNARRHAEAQAQLLLNARVIESSHEGMFITDSAHNITMVNQAMCDIVGYSEEELLGQRPSLLKSGRHDAAFYQRLWTSLRDTGRWEGEIYDRRKSGEIFPAWLAITRVAGDNIGSDNIGSDNIGSDHYIAIYRDISERKAYEQRIEHLASHDILTDLPNRVLLDDRIGVAIARAEREGHPLALLFIDLDRFKLINDTLGHAIGDQLLKAVAARITGELRRSDTVGRVGGDEFVVLIEKPGSALAAAHLAEKLIDAIARPYSINGHELLITASAGVAMYPEHALDPAGLTRIADIAMMAAKQSGHNRYHLYSGEMGVDASERLDLQNQLRGAIARNELFLAYQPQVHLGDGRVVGLEALARWRHHRLGLVPPNRFIPIAEDSGLIVELGAWILEEACRQCQHWRTQGVIDVPVSVNVSALQFHQLDFIGTVSRALARSGLPASRLELEVTESLLMSNVSDTRETLAQIHDMGVQIAIDDFGTGYSSLAYLREFPAQRLKIDQSFIRDLPANQDAAAITRAIVSLGNTLGMDIVAEGVETEQQADFLLGVWCQLGQGYLFTPPLPREELEDWLASWNNRKDPADTTGD